jgi:putative ABC transport system permease protein
MTARPPRVARWIIAAATPAADRDALVGDLDELYAMRRDRSARWRADLWYWRQVARSVAPLTARRFQPSSPQAMANESRQTEPMAASLYFLRHAFRRLMREPAFTIAAVLTLALGIGGNVAVFALVEAVLLRPLPYPNADRLITLGHRDTRTGITKEFIAIGDYVDLVARQQSFDAIGAYGGNQITIFGDGEPFRGRMFAATPGALAALGFRPVLGRSIERDDVRQGGPPVMMLGYEYWRDKMGSNPNVVGTSLKAGQQVRTIIGVAPPSFRFRDTKVADVIFPMTVPAQAPAGRKNGWTFVVGRLKTGVTPEAAAAELTTLSKQFEQEFPTQNQGSLYYATPLRDTLAGNTKPALLLLLAAVAVVLLIACVNVANLLLARSLSRRREMAVRMALGAGRGRLAAQLLAESLALAGVASALGIVIAFWGSKALVALVPRSVEAPGLSDVRLNASVLVFTVGLTILTTLAFGLVAMLTVRLDSSASVLVGAGRTSAGAGARRAASGLVVAEVALAIVLLVGAGLIMRSFSGLLSVDPGFRYDRVMTMSVTLPQEQYRDTASREGFYRSTFAALRAVPGVEDAGVAAVIPLTGNNWTVPLDRADKPMPAGERPPDVGWQAASAGYFRTIGIPLVAGRLFDERDRPGGPTVVVISEAVQRKYFAGEAAVGKQLKTGTTTTAEIVGVVGNIRRAGLRDDPRADLYFPAEQAPSFQTTLFIRTTGDPVKALASLQAAIKSVEPKVIINDAQSFADVAAESVRTTKLVLWLLGVFAATALVLAAIGIYGVMSYVVRQRTREIGTRIALGATHMDIVWLIMRQGAGIAACGAGVGLLAGVAAARALESILFGVTPSDPTTMAAATAVLVGAILAACYVPARRAAAVDPARTLAEQ